MKFLCLGFVLRKILICLDMIQHAPFFLLPPKAELLLRNKRPFILESFESTSSAGLDNRHIECPQKQLSQHLLERVLTLPNIYVFFDINKPLHWLLS